MMEIEKPVSFQGQMGVQVAGGHQPAPPPCHQPIFDSLRIPSKMENDVQRGKNLRDDGQ